MKKILFSIIGFLACIFSIQAQTLFGTTFNGGTDGGGTISEFIPSTNNLTVVQSFKSAALPGSNFIKAADGKLYGMAAIGGSSGDGAIFAFDPVTFTYTKLEDFNNANGAEPQGGLMQASNGKLYGMTYRGGSNDAGVLFSFDPASSIYTKLIDFDGSNGANPIGDIMEASDGKLYGMTQSGGNNGYGVIFSFDPSSITYTVLKGDFDFGDIDGYHPSGTLVQASNGKLYGLAESGGSNNDGVIFSFDISSFVYTKLMDFDYLNGAFPHNSLTQASDGKLYGMTIPGGTNGFGVIFSFDPVSSSYTKLREFDSASGRFCVGSLIKASDGKLYGSTNNGGSKDFGVIFSFDPLSSTYTKLKDFDSTNGGNPSGSLIQSGDEKFYGMTSSGGNGGLGVIFSFDPSASAYNKLTDFGVNENGSNALGRLTQALDGKLYGMMNVGGSSGGGIIFSFNPASFAFTKLKDFNYADGVNPYGYLIQATNGKLYGMTFGGGSSGYGVIFSFDPLSTTYTKVKDFDVIDGARPDGSLTQATDGKLYGMTSGGGSTGSGIIFSFDPPTSAFTKLKDFETSTNGGSPTGSLIQASDGKLYGMSTNGELANFGYIFSFDPLSSSFTILKSFDLDGLTGYNPEGDLMQAGDGKFYGTTLNGGSNGVGVIFSFDPSTSTYTNLKNFDTIDGAHPIGTLKQGSDGKIYGTTFGGGSNDDGVIFSYDPISSTYTKLKDYNGNNGAHPAIASAFIELSNALPVNIISFTGKKSGNTNQLSWKIANEQDLNYYELQRGIDGQNFKVIFQIKAIGNNSYNYTDPIVSEISSIYYYRLKNVDKDGKFKYSQVIKIRTDLKDLVVVNPNPFKNKLVVNIESLIQDKAVLIITDIGGKRLYKQNVSLSPGSNVIGINETGKLSNGSYLLTIIGSQQTQSIKVVKAN